MDHSIQDFLNAVLPSHGLLCIVGLMHDRTAPPVVEYFARGDSKADELIASLDDNGREVYFGCATYTDSSKPKAVNNVQQIKSFYIDIDCGKNGCYQNKKEARDELVRFCQEITLPMPTVVDSGNGIHAYWTLTHSVDYNTWKPIADALKKKSAEKGLKIDNSVTGDGARILRVPFTSNKKRPDKVRPVKLICVGDQIDLEEFKSIIGYIDLGGASQNPDQDPVMAALLKSSRSFKFSRIHRKNIEEVIAHENVEEEYDLPNGTKAIRLVKKKIARSSGCPQLAYCVANRATLENNMWMAALSIAWYCTDQAEAVEAVSKDHEDYDFANSCYHASRMKGPRKCEEFKKLDHPYLCNDCIHNGKIKSPIVLGATIEEAAPDDNIIEVMHETLGEKQEIEIPATYPFPFFRPKNGGVAMRVQASDDPNDDDAAEERAICARDMWVKSRSKDGTTELATIALRLPHDGLTEFTAPLPVLYKTETLRELLASKGVHEAANDAKLKLIKSYLSEWTKKLQDEGKANKARTQFGWQDENTVFVLGNREIDRNGVVHVATIAHSIENITRSYVKRGSFEEWQKVANTYGRPGNEARGFSLFCSFGAPLYKFIGEGSVLLHLTNVASGVGKSTAQKIANSVWGHPTDTLMIDDDTVNAKLHRAGVLNNIPACIDEITNMAPDKASPLAFSLSQGRGKNRMTSSANSERINDTTWSTIFQTSGNNSLYDTIRLHKQIVEGELLRILEIPVPLDTGLTKAQADELFSQILPYNYGHAGEIYMKYVVPNLDTVLDRMREIHKEFDELVGLGSKERFYSSCFAAAFAGAEIANKLGIINIPVEPIKEWVRGLLLDVRKAVAKGGFSTNADSFGKFVSRYWNEIIAQVLTINKGSNPVDDALMNQAALRPVIGALKGRYEVTSNRLYVSAAEFDSWMSSNRVPSVQVLNGLRQTSTLVYEGEMNLGKDTVIYKTGSVAVYGFDTKRLEPPER